MKKKAMLLHIDSPTKSKLTFFLCVEFWKVLATGFCEFQHASTLGGEQVTEAVNAGKRKGINSTDISKSNDI